MGCRTAREALSQTGAAFGEREFFKERFTEDELRRLLGDRPARDIFSWRGVTARKLGLNTKQNELSDDELFRLMVEEPNLIRRPFFTVDGEIIPGWDKPARARLAELGIAVSH